MDVGPLVVADAQTAKLTEPGKGALYDPAPPDQTTPMLGAAHRQEGHGVTSPETAPNGNSVVAAVPEDTAWPLPRSPTFAVQWGNRIHQRQGLLRVIRFAPLRRIASGTPRPSQIRCRLLPRLARSVGFGPA